MNWREFQTLQRVVKLGDRFVSYVTEGSGDPVLLLHGIPTWGYLWHGLIPALAKTCRVFAPDLLGFGYSDKSDHFDRSIARQAEMIDAWMDKLGIERASIVGHDLGGGVALRLATLFPHRVTRLCVMNTVCYDSWPIEAMLQLGHPKAYHSLSAANTVATMRQALKQGFASSQNGELLEGLLAPYTTEVGKLSLIRNAAALNTNLTMEISPLLLQMAMPTLILWGEEDLFQPVKYGERLASDIPGARLIRIRGARHFVMFDRPDEVTEDLVMFLGGS
ncbi:MAG: alpha/beta hydrolase [Candidatus Tectomicrobia bacterium]|uniref:Alpha/beta hydrolase n=1 Tax=Tectimicrobiota bacterium TaxID=2528274 RepID=A0A932FWP4_UNCTE|nr:alpha/beta hydrolase [Candidatus Tectomicrobia bacterium]